MEAKVSNVVRRTNYISAYFEGNSVGVKDVLIICAELVRRAVEVYPTRQDRFAILKWFIEFVTDAVNVTPEREDPRNGPRRA